MARPVVRGSCLRMAGPPTGGKGLTGRAGRCMILRMNTKDTDRLVKLNVLVPTRTLAALKEAAAKESGKRRRLVTVSELVREVIEGILDRK